MARSNAVGKLREIVEARMDPKSAVRKELGDLSKDKVTRCQVLVATYAGQKTHSGTSILRIDQDLNEQRFQGSIGLVVALGPGAFKDAPGASFHGIEAKVGDWVLTRPADGLQMLINSVPCRLFEDVNILMVVDDPDKFY